jgi:endonuclease IV
LEKAKRKTIVLTSKKKKKKKKKKRERVSIRSLIVHGSFFYNHACKLIRKKTNSSIHVLICELAPRAMFGKVFYFILNAIYCL